MNKYFIPIVEHRTTNRCRGGCRPAWAARLPYLLRPSCRAELPRCQGDAAAQTCSLREPMSTLECMRTHEPCRVEQPAPGKDHRNASVYDVTCNSFR